MLSIESGVSKRMIDSEPTNEALLKDYQNGNFSSFDRFYKKNHTIIFCYLLKRVSHKEIAEDLLQETFFRIHKYITSYKTDKGAMNWVFTIAHHVLVDHWNKFNGTENLTGRELDGSLTAEEQVALKLKIENILASLNESDRELFKQRLVEELSFEEIAEKNRIKSSSARQKISRMLRKIRTGTF